MLGTFVWIVSIVRFRASFFQNFQFFDLDLITLNLSGAGNRKTAPIDLKFETQLKSVIVFRSLIGALPIYKYFLEKSRDLYSIPL